MAVKKPTGTLTETEKESGERQKTGLRSYYSPSLLVFGSISTHTTGGTDGIQEVKTLLVKRRDVYETVCLSFCLE